MNKFLFAVGICTISPLSYNYIQKYIAQKELEKEFVSCCKEIKDQLGNEYTHAERCETRWINNEEDKREKRAKSFVFTPDNGEFYECKQKIYDDLYIYAKIYGSGNRDLEFKNSDDEIVISESVLYSGDRNIGIGSWEDTIISFDRKGKRIQRHFSKFHYNDAKEETITLVP